MGVNINDLRRTQTIGDVIRTGVSRLHYVSIKDFRFDQDGNLLVRRDASVREDYPFLPTPSHWVGISLFSVGLCVIRRNVKWNRVTPIEGPDDGWLRVADIY